MEVIGLLALGSVGFWALAITVFLFLFFMVEFEKPAWATITLVLAFVALAVFGNFNLWLLVKQNPMQAGLVGVLYFVAGAVWSVAKWWFFVRERRSNYRELRADFMRRHSLAEEAQIPDNLLADWRQSVEQPHPYRGGNGKEVAKPLIREHKGRITMWMTYWPWSMTWTMINDPVKKLWRWIYLQLQGWYEAIANSIYKGTENDLRPIPKASDEPEVIPPRMGRTR